MIEIKDKKDCAGCTACTEICPKKCIQMKPDEEGFLYPVVDKNRCVECNACNMVCPIQNPIEDMILMHLKVYRMGINIKLMK